MEIRFLRKLDNKTKTDRTTNNNYRQKFNTKLVSDSE